MNMLARCDRLAGKADRGAIAQDRLALAMRAEGAAIAEMGKPDAMPLAVMMMSGPAPATTRFTVLVVLLVILHR